MSKENLLRLYREAREAAQDPNEPESYRTYYRLEAQHWYTKAHHPDQKSYLEMEDAAVIYAVALAPVIVLILYFFVL